jgi:hypothetical protein
MDSSSAKLSDGLDVLRAEMSIAEIMRLIENTARWVDPKTFELLPVWYPEYARRVPIYKANWSEPQLNTNRETKISEHKREGNRYANHSLTLALGLRSDDRPNWSCCHIWGIDDASFQETNAVVQDRRFYSCVANMVLLPTPLKAFTDAMPEIKAMLRICARYLYGWSCDHEKVASSVSVVDSWEDWSAYPTSWPAKDRQRIPKGVVPINSRIETDIQKRKKQLRTDLTHAGIHYPKEEVQKTLQYWNISL